MLCKFFFPTPFHNYHSPKLKKKKKKRKREKERKRGRRKGGKEKGTRGGKKDFSQSKSCNGSLGAKNSWTPHKETVIEYIFVKEDPLKSKEKRTPVRKKTKPLFISSW